LHGEAISIGQVAAANLSAKLAGLSATEMKRITELFRRAGLPVQIQLNRQQCQHLVEAMRLDKKVSGGEIKFVLAERIGKVIWGQKVPLELVQEVLEFQKWEGGKARR
jgi:3-dehydroquinate synthase